VPDATHRSQDDPAHLRRAIRAGELTGSTAGLAPGYLQANLVILPEAEAFDFLRYCERNPKPCPLLAVGEPGDPALPALGGDIDVSRDLPGYRVFRNGELSERRGDVADLWRDDLVAFAIGCSFSWEEELLAQGIPLRHVAERRNVAMYVTDRSTEPSGRFAGNLVVSMRPFAPADAIRAIQITTRFPKAHGAPVHFADPGAIGIGDLAKPDFGEANRIEAGEVPVFWACGVTPQVAIRQAGVELCITHEPGCMLITDLSNAGTAVL
jgi:uncharacterized protein YcsI (UPF0317 family)